MKRVVITGLEALNYPDNYFTLENEFIYLNAENFDALDSFEDLYETYHKYRFEEYINESEIELYLMLTPDFVAQFDTFTMAEVKGFRKKWLLDINGVKVICVIKKIENYNGGSTKVTLHTHGYYNY